MKGPSGRIRWEDEMGSTKERKTKERKKERRPTFRRMFGHVLPYPFLFFPLPFSFLFIVTSPRGVSSMLGVLGLAVFLFLPFVTS